MAEKNEAGDVLNNLAPGIPTDDEGTPQKSSFLEDIDTNPVNEPVVKAEEEGETDPKEGEAEDDKATPLVIPKARFDEVLARNRALEKRVAEAGAQEAPAAAPEFDFAGAEKEYMDFAMEGEVDKASEIRVKINQAQEDRILAKVNATYNKDNEASTVQGYVEAAATLKQIEADHPELVPSNKEFDQDLVNEIADLRDALDAQGKYLPADSLQRAADLVLGKSTKSTKSLKPKSTLKAKVEAANKQAPDMGAAGTGNKVEGKVDVDQLTQDQFEALPLTEVSKLRGDVIEINA